MYHEMHPMWLPEAQWSSTKRCRLSTGLKWRLDQQLVSLTSQLRVVVIATWSGGAWHVLRSIGMHFSLT